MRVADKTKLQQPTKVLLQGTVIQTKKNRR